MAKVAENIIKAAVKLPEKDRVRAVEQLLSSLEPEEEQDVDAAWAAEIERALGKKSSLIDSGKSLGKIGKLPIEIVTYQLFARCHEAFVNSAYTCVVMDEIQFIRNNESKAWKAAKQIRSDFFFGLSGTVIENRLDDLFSIMDVISPDYFGPKWKFSQKYQNLLAVSPKTLIFGGLKNVEQLREEIKDVVFGYDNLQLPPISHTFIKVGMDKEQQRQHDSYHAEAKKLLAKNMSQGLSYAEKMILQAFLLKARQACNSISLITKMASPPSAKLREITQLVMNQFAKGKKVVLFSQWTEMLDIVAVELKKRNLGYVFYTGRESEAARMLSIQRFINSANVQVFLASDSGGVGIDGLQKASHVVIHTELPWNPARLDQRSGRVHRLGQTNPVEVFYTYASNSIEEGMLATLQDKRNVREMALGVD